ncbi:dimethylarginine dimethylaminohydrolase family protein [Metabacillus arenae]|uniref:N-Dimethylarginine dimethylaminohydrolase n=1 Tax=Metabacillus arenae TaxID=2771434 RepID=A0A926RVP5_9BACI|nr:arginine deiminase family protein [Metabacillus arenae]MBD1378680.1 hypothetical protein [Metabacillus arenae]
MEMSINNETKVNCQSEYFPLHKVILCEPKYMRISEIINETQRRYKKDNINTKLAQKQHHRFLGELRMRNIETILLPPIERYPEQVFTRDIGFTIGEKLFVSQMGMKLRQGEEKILINWLDEQQIPYFNLKEHSVEGGDVIVDQNTVYVGVSDRTEEGVTSHLQHILPDYEIISLPLASNILHLDCVFNPISSEEALIYSPALTKDDIDILSSRYKLIEVSEEEQFTLGTNTLSIGDKKIISLPQNKEVNKKLRSLGYEIIEVDISEIIKSGGSFRCCTLPLVRN